MSYCLFISANLLLVAIHVWGLEGSIYENRPFFVGSSQNSNKDEMVDSLRLLLTTINIYLSRYSDWSYTYGLSRVKHLN